MLEFIDSPDDLKGLSEKELNPLCAEIRQFIIDNVSRCGGHLASNLGVVELTVALHYVFDCPRDKFIWDVGHQSYTHKILTGRKGGFPKLRQAGGVSGFPKPEESACDAFLTGHSSTSISAAVGFAAARDMLAEKYKIIAIIGDGSMTSGLAFEGLNQAGHLKKDMIVILNDNEMSISRNVGALSAYLNRILTGELYRKFKSSTREFLRGIPKFGPQMSKAAERLEEAFKGIILPGVLFEEMGFNYIGPIDGHDMNVLLATLRGASGLSGPVLIHAVTRKGKGYEPSEQDPCVFHGIGPFEVETGKTLKSSFSYSEYFGEALSRCARKDPRIIAITAAMKEGTGLTAFEKEFPARLYDVGIAEPHAVVFAAGLARSGFRPVVAIYSTFLQRSYDEIIHDVCLQNLPVVFAIDRAGVVGEDGPTHHGMFDLSYLRHIPNLTVMAPKDAPELEAMLKFALDLKGPAAVRYPRGKAIVEDGEDLPPISLGRTQTLKMGADAAVLAIGNMAGPSLEAARRLEMENLDVMVCNMRFVKPLDEDAIREAAATGRIVTVEDNAVLGGFGSAVCEALMRMGLGGIKFQSLGYPDVFVEHGSQAELRARHGLDAQGISRAVKNLVAASPVPDSSRSIR
ncbi:MAG: 1-deoxy-D-xylulose-5-phosphate synthase [Nitrospiraceae bacterium]|nr:1-deoxy-D-xylulose-5-phosphate synthase [Nitrospiraceae bacterium]